MYSEVTDPSYLERFLDFVRSIRGRDGYTNEEFQSALNTAKAREQANATNAAEELNVLQGQTLIEFEARKEQFDKEFSRMRFQIGPVCMNHKDAFPRQKFEKHLSTLNGGKLPELLLANLYLMCQQGILGTAMIDATQKFAAENMSVVQKGGAPVQVTIVKNEDGTWTVTGSKLADLLNMATKKTEGTIELHTQMRFSAGGRPLSSLPGFRKIVPEPLPYQIQISTMLP